jgi:hypothetical protein
VSDNARLHEGSRPRTSSAVSAHSPAQTSTSGRSRAARPPLLLSSRVVGTRSEKSARLRSILARYRGGTFETGSSGGAGGMVFFRDREGGLFYIGGFNPADARQICTALNLVLDLLETKRD